MASLKQLSVALTAAILSFPNRTVAGSAETTDFTVRSDSSAIQGGDFATRSVDEEDQRNIAARGFISSMSVILRKSLASVSIAQ